MPIREIEVKLKVQDLESVAKKLKERGCIISAPIRQHDFIYSYDGSTTEWEQAREGHIVLRIRRENSGASFTLKQQCSNESDNLEYETKIEDAEAMHQALLALRYTPQVEVKKVRRKGKLGEYEICLDDVEGLGNFVELEKLTSDDVNPDEVRKELFQVLESLGFSRGDEETRGYDTQIYHLRRAS